MSAHVLYVYLVVVVQVPNVVDRVLKVLRSPGHAHIFANLLSSRIIHSKNNALKQRET